MSYDTKVTHSSRSPKCWREAQAALSPLAAAMAAAPEGPDRGRFLNRQHHTAERAGLRGAARRRVGRQHRGGAARTA